MILPFYHISLHVPNVSHSSSAGLACFIYQYLYIGGVIFVTFWRAVRLNPALPFQDFSQLIGVCLITSRYPMRTIYFALLPFCSSVVNSPSETEDSGGTRGRNPHCQSDLEYFMTGKKLNWRQPRRSFELANYSSTLVHRPGNTMGRADALSR